MICPIPKVDYSRCRFIYTQLFNSIMHVVILSINTSIPHWKTIINVHKKSNILLQVINLNENLDFTSINLFQIENNTNVHTMRTIVFVIHKFLRKSSCPMNKYHLQLRNTNNVHNLYLKSIRFLTIEQ
jgi:hypothetical protein